MKTGGGVSQMSWHDEMDPHFAALWADFVADLAARQVLDDRVRLLVAIGQCVVIGETDEVATVVTQALSANVPVSEIHEVMLQACVYVGRPTVRRSLNVFADLLSGAGRMNELLEARLPRHGPNVGRSMDQESSAKLVADERFPRRDELITKYGWQGISTLLSTQPWDGAQMIERADAVDENYTRSWVKFIQAGLYSRRVLDDKTRTLCMMANCLALPSHAQTEKHMRNALILGCTPTEVLEVFLQSTQYIGMPRAHWGRDLIQRVMAEGRT
jgi:4-carboxymuconolactone decarboxylase